MDTKQSSVAVAIAAALGISTGTLPGTVSAATLADGFYDMVIHNTPYTTGSGYDIGSDGAWNSSFTFASMPGVGTYTMYDDTVASPINGKYAGNPNDGVTGTIGIHVAGGVISGTGQFEFDMIPNTAGGNFVEYGSSSGFTGSIDAAGNISLTPTGLLGTFSAFPSLVDERWNVDNFNGITGTTVNPPNNNTAWVPFTTGSTTNDTGTINGAAYDGTTAILVKGASFGSDWGGFFGANYFEVWNVSFVPTTVPIPAAAWLFGSGLLGLMGVARRKKR